MSQLLGLATFAGANNYGQLVPFDSSVNYKPLVNTSRSSWFEEHYRTLLAANDELSIIVGDLRRERNATEYQCNKLNSMLEARDRDNALYHLEIDRLVGEKGS